jgi:peroxiredoxin
MLQNFDNLHEIIAEMVCETGESVAQFSDNQPVMLVFLRHFGCTFCREGLDELSKKRKNIEEMGTRLIFVHMTDNKTANKYFDEFNLSGAMHVSDPECFYYMQFGLTKGTFTQLFGFQNWARAFNTGVVKGYGWANQIGDGFQMPGVFIIFQREIKSSYRHKYASDQPDYVELASCCQI